MQNINEIIALNAELEGLLHILAKRDNASIRELLETKYRNYTAAFEGLLDEMHANPLTEDTDTLATVDHLLAQDEAKDQEAVSEEVEDEMDAATAAIERGEHDETNETEDEEDDPSLLCDDPDIPEENPESEVDDSDETVIAETEETPEQETPSEIRVDEMLSRKGASDLKRVFTLNDKFLFRKALFNQDDDKFAETLEQLASFDTFTRAKDYLINNLGWDLADENVDLFLSIIKPHYAQ